MSPSAQLKLWTRINADPNGLSAIYFYALFIRVDPCQNAFSLRDSRRSYKDMFLRYSFCRWRVDAVIEESSMGMISEFKEFVSRGNVVDLAVGVVIGAAFGKIVSSLVDGLVMPTVGLLTGGVKFSDLAVTLREAQIDAAGKEIAPALLLKYGAFLQTLIDFLLIALVIFLFLKAYNRVRTPAPAAATPEDVLLLREIRDSLKK